MVLRDGRHLVGILRSYDQFSNVVLEQCVERRTLLAGTENVAATHTQQPPQQQRLPVVCDEPVGLYLVRGDQIVLLVRFLLLKGPLKKKALPVNPQSISFA